MGFDDISSSKTVIYARTTPEHIADVNWIMEGYEHLALVSTEDSTAGLIRFSATPDTYPEVIDIICNMPFQVQIVESFK